MRVALLCPYSLSRPGGVQGQVVGLAVALNAAGHDAVVLAPADDDIAVPGLTARSLVRLGHSMSLPANGSVAPVALGPGAALRAVRAVREGGFDVVHIHEPLAPGPNFACLVACAVPKVGTFHRAGKSIAYTLLSPLARALARRLAARCAVSSEARATAQHALGGRYDIIGNGIDLERFASAPGSATSGPTVMFVGRHEERKGLGVLLDAVGRLEPAVSLTVWVAGQGPDTEWLRRRHPPSDRIVWLGRLDDLELAARLAGAHALCAPALRGESFGVVLLEAMAARAAVVASDLPGYRAVVEGHGLLFPPGDVGALASALESVVGDAASGTGLCAPAALDAAFRHASQWSMPEVAQRYVAVYERVLAESRLAR
ncbi:MAG TPA: glycosyltransferase family 4 protein [Acidimicrobiales bacterium]|nr:glycosyltransferase family 4 protein [Acidimicrobiales bacterium]